MTARLSPPRIVCLAMVAALVAVAAFAQETRTTQINSTTVGPRAPVRVEVFVNSAMTVTNAEGATVYRVDELELIEDELSQGLPADEAQAAAIAQERLSRMAPALQARMAKAAEGKTQAASYGIDRVPAMVLDGKSIVYGVTDVARAVELYRQRTTPGGKQ